MTAISESLVRDAMSRPVVGLEPTMSVADAVELARERRVTHFPVVARGATIGVVCTCDLDEAPLSSDVSSIMHVPAASVSADDSLNHAAALMAKLGVGSLIVVSGDETVGILTRTDLERCGLADVAFGEQRCSACREIQHVRLDQRCGYWLCASCRQAEDDSGGEAE
jgi:predicted transcriptional regulator